MAVPSLFYLGNALDTSPVSFGALRSSKEVLDDPGELQRRMADDGYLYLPGQLDSEEVREARMEVLRRLRRVRRVR